MAGVATALYCSQRADSSLLGTSFTQGIMRFKWDGRCEHAQCAQAPYEYDLSSLVYQGTRASRGGRRGQKKDWVGYSYSYRMNSKKYRILICEKAWKGGLRSKQALKEMWTLNLWSAHCLAGCSTWEHRGRCQKRHSKSYTAHQLISVQVISLRAQQGWKYLLPLTLFNIF